MNSIDGLTQIWGLEINIAKTNSTLSFLSTVKKQIKLQLKDETVPQRDTDAFFSMKLNAQHSWKPQTEKMEKSNLQELALTRKLTH